MYLRSNASLEVIFLIWLLANPTGRIIYAEASEEGEIDPSSIEELNGTGDNLSDLGR